MYRLVRCCSICICLLAAFPSCAQGNAKPLAELLKMSFTAPKNIGGVLSAGQLRSLQYRFHALEETRRALYQNPGWAQSPQFSEVNRSLRQMGLPLPKQPGAAASRQEKETFRQNLDDLLYRESQVLGQIIQKKPRPKTPAKLLVPSLEKLLKNQLASAKKEGEMFLQKSPVFSWGTPHYDEIRVQPWAIGQNPKDPRYISPGIMHRISQHAQLPMQDFFAAILQEEQLSPRQKQTLISAIYQASDLLTYPFVQIYTSVFKTIPSLSFDAAVVPGDETRALQQYAIALQKVLLTKLQQKGFWSEADFEAFAEASVYLPPQKARTVLGAVTYLEPSSARWLLDTPLEDPASQKILAQIELYRQKKDAIWPDGEIRPKFSAGINFARLRQMRLKALQARAALLQERYEKLVSHFMLISETCLNSLKSIESGKDLSQQFLDDALSQYISLSSSKTRTQHLIELTYHQMQLLQKELGKCQRP